MFSQTVEISVEQKHLLQGLRRLIPDLDPENPETLRRIFNLGLFALVMQAVSRQGASWKQNLVRELAATVREMVGNMRV